jgi:hypothetical protein
MITVHECVKEQPSIHFTEITEANLEEIRNRYRDIKCRGFTGQTFKWGSPGDYLIIIKGCPAIISPAEFKSQYRKASHAY